MVHCWAWGSRFRPTTLLFFQSELPNSLANFSVKYMPFVFREKTFLLWSVTFSLPFESLMVKVRTFILEPTLHSTAKVSELALP